MVQPTLVILAAGMASRYGSMKQTEGFGPNGETIMDYSVFDAINAGFGKVVFIIREDFATVFKEQFSSKFEDKIKVEFVFQSIDRFVEAEYIPADRTKPWGTGQAMLCAEEKVQEPFTIINADDFYGADAFQKAAEFCREDCSEAHYALIGYNLSNTLSENGTVSRGVCKVDEVGNLTEINETHNIHRKDEKIVFEEAGAEGELTEQSYVSMNFWCFHPDIFTQTKALFAEFPKNNMENLKAEFYIPTVVSNFIETNVGVVEVIPTAANWFGVTYKEDAPTVKEKLHSLIAEGIYPVKLW